MRDRSQPHDSVFPRALARALGLAAVLLLAACSEDDSGRRRIVTPTDPAVPAPTAAWSGSWTVDQVTPAGDCLAEALNEFAYGLAGWRFDLQLEREAGQAHLRFHFGQGVSDGEGFWPLEFSGSVGPGGAIAASVPAARIGALRTDPWMELCYWEWSMHGGELSATLSADGRQLAGTIVESFRAIPENVTFTVHSHFTATAP